MTTKKDTTMNYMTLADEIVIRAAKDYRRALKILKNHPENDTALRRKYEVERFFYSEWFRVLSNLDAEALITALKKEAEA